MIYQFESIGIMTFHKCHHADPEEVATNLYRLGVLYHENSLNYDAYDCFIESRQLLKDVHFHSPVSSLSLQRLARFHLE